MRVRFRYSLTTLLLLPLLVGIGIKLYRGPHEFSLVEEHRKQVSELVEQDPNARCILHRVRTGKFWAYRNLDGSLTRHGPEESFGPLGDKKVTEYRDGQRHGLHRCWDIEGQLICEGQYEHDEAVGEWMFYTGA